MMGRSESRDCWRAISLGDMGVLKGSWVLEENQIGHKMFRWSLRDLWGWVWYFRTGGEMKQVAEATQEAQNGSVGQRSVGFRSG